MARPRLTGNPTRTRTIELAWLREIRRRWRAFTRAVLPALDQANTMALITNAPADPFVLSAEQQRVYLAFLQQQIDRLLLGTPEAPNWQAEYQLQSYVRGFDRTRASLQAQGEDITPTPEEAAAAELLEEFTAQPSLATAPRQLPAIHRDALAFLFQRSYGALEGWTDALVRDTREILFGAVREGKSVRETTREIRDRIGVSQRRAERIARTEVNQAYSRSSLSEVERLNDEFDAGLRVRWLTAIVMTRKGNPVRPAHARLHGRVISTEEAEEVKRTDGVNCRCALAPVVRGTNTPETQAFFDAQRAQTLAITRAGT